MKKIYALAVIAFAAFLQFCATTKPVPAPAPAVAKINYVSNVEPLLVQHCSPCHFPPQGNKKPLNTYKAAKGEIDEIIERIQRNPGKKGFMPAKHPKLADSVITVFVQWENEGTPER